MIQRVLIVDDDVKLLDSFRRWINRELRCEVHCACDLAEAEALLDCYEYVLVMTDLSLSSQRLEGFDLIDRIASAPLKPKLIALTGHGSKEIRSIALRKGADIFLEKPTPIHELMEVVRGLIGSRNEPCAVGSAEGRLLNTLFQPLGIEPYFQPIFLVRDGKLSLVGLECLSRGPAGTPFANAEALFAYARYKRAEPVVDQECITLALKAASRIPEDIFISVNAHASTLSRCSDFAEWLCSCALSNPITLNRLTVEIVEHAPVWNKVEFQRALGDLRKAGIKIALDDLGLGHSNYQMIVDARPDYFKIDRYFVHGCFLDKQRKAVVSSIAKLAADLQGRVVAEGVERADDLQELQSIGIDLFQSFLFCPPVRAEEFSALKATSLAEKQFAGEEFSRPRAVVIDCPAVSQEPTVFAEPDSSWATDKQEAMQPR